MAVPSATAEKIEQPQMADQPPPPRLSDASAVSSEPPSSSPPPPSGADPPDHTATTDQLNSTPSSSRQPEIQQSYKSEEYRQLFRLPPEEVLIEDFNCALQENFLLQGHMYLFVHYICFYGNIFGFEAKKVIPFQEVTSVRRAKAAVLFPTAIEVIAAGKKYFFTSFLSRDEAFKLINDGWLQHGNEVKDNLDEQVLKELKAITDPQVTQVNDVTELHQGSSSESNSRDNGMVIVERAESFRQPVDELDLAERNKDAFASEDSEFGPVGEAEVVSTSSGRQVNVDGDTEVALNSECSSSGNSLVWEAEDSDAPEVPEYYTMVAETKFPLKVVEFFSLFFSDNSIDFHDLFHRKCGDKDFKCTSWYAHDKFGHARDVAFQHPIKLYFGARFGSCQEIQKYRVYRSSHLVVDTSQVISDVPYGDYFCVEGLWDVKQDGDESKKSCLLRVYTNVAFSKKTMWKGKIVQSTVEECRDAYAIWIDLAHEFLKQKNLEKQEEAGSHEANLVATTQAIPKRQENFGEQPEMSKEQRGPAMPGLLPDSNDVEQPSISLRRSISGVTSVASLLRDSVVKFCLSLKSGSQVPAFALAVVAIIFLLMQISIIMLLARPQQIHVVPQAHCVSSRPGGASERGAETMLFLDNQISHLKEEMLMVETLLGKMQHEHSLLKRELNDLVLLREQHR